MSEDVRLLVMLMWGLMFTWIAVCLVWPTYISLQHAHSILYTVSLRRYFWIVGFRDGNVVIIFSFRIVMKIKDGTFILWMLRAYSPVHLPRYCMKVAFFGVLVVSELVFSARGGISSSNCWCLYVLVDILLWSNPGFAS